MALYEYHETLPSIWSTAKEFASEHPDWVVPDEEGSGSLWKFVKDNNNGDYNRCHFWSNFQVRGSVSAQGSSLECIAHSPLYSS